MMTTLSSSFRYLTIPLLRRRPRPRPRPRPWQRTSLVVDASHRYVVLTNRRLLSSTDAKANDDDDDGAPPNLSQPPLVLWLPSTSTSLKGDMTKRRILVPSFVSKSNNSTQGVKVHTPQDVVDAVHNHYELSTTSSDDDNDNIDDESKRQQFVGGMGESDPGVWFACHSSSSSTTNTHDDDDPLNHVDLIRESIHAVKQSRHGVPFGTFTSGIGLPDDVLSSPNIIADIGLSQLQVSLLASNPTEYAQASALQSSSSEATKRFGQVCGFCVAVAESGFPLEVNVLKQYASSARDLATSLGAVQVHIHDDDDDEDN